MPIYRYRNPKSGAEIDVVQKMNDKHEYRDSDGVEYERIFENPNVSKDTSINAFSSKDFVNKARSSNMNVGEMWDLSKELSLKRKSIAGKDHIKENYNKQKHESRAKNIKKNTG